MDPFVLALDGAVGTSVIRSHRDLLVWQKGMDLVERVYALTRSLPVHERFGLIGQATRAAYQSPPTSPKGTRDPLVATTPNS